MSKGTLLVLTGASSVGKAAIREQLLNDPSMKLFYSISMTTRPQKPEEQDGVDYYFVDQKTFASAVRNHELLEYTQFDGYYYGTPLAYIDLDSAARGRAPSGPRSAYSPDFSSSRP